MPEEKRTIFQYLQGNEQFSPFFLANDYNLMQTIVNRCVARRISTGNPQCLIWPRNCMVRCEDSIELGAGVTDIRFRSDGTGGLYNTVTLDDVPPGEIPGGSSGGPLWGGMIELIESKRIIVDRMKLQGAHPENGVNYAGTDWEGLHGVGCYATEDVIIRNCNIRNVWGDGIYLGNFPSTGPLAQRIRCLRTGIYNNVIHRNGRQGVAPVQASYTDIAYNHFDFIARWIVDAEPSGHQIMNIDNLHIHDNFADLCFQGFMVCGGGEGGVDGVYVWSNDMTRIALSLWFVGAIYEDGTLSKRNCVMRNNTSDTRNPSFRMLWVGRAHNIWISQNHGKPRIGDSTPVDIETPHTGLVYSAGDNFWT